jgi:hypothetical protein
MQTFFPGATGYQAETRTLSGLRLEMARRLGRQPTAEENLLQLNRVSREQELLGYVLTQRVKGEYGAIELVLAVLTNGQVQGLRLQRLREEEVVAGALQNPAWLGSFRGKSAKNDWRLGHDIPEVVTEARSSAQAVVEGVRGLLIRLETSQVSNVPHLHDRP